MSKLIYILVASWLLIGACIQSDRNSKNGGQDSKGEKEATVEIDTILEPNNPKLLDLSVHQLFLDTTRDSRFFQSLKSWKVNEIEQSSLEQTFHYFLESEKLQKVDWIDFPRMFIELKKLNDFFVLYDRCDGNSPRFELQDSAFVYFEVHEPTSYPIQELIVLEPNRLEVVLRSYATISEGKYDTLTIQTTKDDRVFLMTFFNQNQFITPVENINQFDLVVNHCTTRKILEFNGFDE